MPRDKTKYTFVLCGLMFILPLFNTAKSQQTANSLPNEELIPVVAQFVPIEFELKRAGRLEMISFQRSGKVYLPVQSVFDFLRIRNTYFPADGVLAGFFVSPDTPYTIDAREMQARVGNRNTTLFPEDVVLQGDSMYLRVDMFNQLFGLPVVYKPRALTASLTTQIPLPVYLDRRLKRYEDELTARPGRLKPETSFDRTFSFLDGGRLDYTLRQTVSSENVPGRTFSTRATGTVLGGDAEARLLGNLSSSVDILQARAQWRYVPVHDGIISQYTVGDFVTSGLLSREIYGVQLTNHPASPRIFFADERLVGPTEFQRGVFMFQNSRLTAVESDTSEAYKLNVGLRYGVNFVDVMEYGYWGETNRSAYRIAVPTDLVPPGDLDYTIAFGRLRDVANPWHGELSSQWGVSSRITAGVRTEYWGNEGLPTNVFPDFNLTARLTDHLIGTALVSPNAMLRGGLELTLPSQIGGSFSYTDFRQVRIFNPRSALNEMIAQATLPFSLNGERFELDLGGTQTILNFTRERNFSAGFNAFIGMVSPGVTTQYGWVYSYNAPVGTTIVFHETEPSIRMRLPANLFLSLSAPYDHIAGSFRNFRLDAAIQPVPNLLLEFQSDRSFAVGNTVARLSLQYVFPFARVTLGSTRSGDGSFYDQSVSGSFGAAPQLGEFFFDNTASRAGFGGILVVPFIDANLNGVRDQGEEILNSARLSASTIGEGGSQLTQVPGVGWVITRAIPYQEYVVQLEQKSLDNPLWIPRYHVVSTSAAPGSFTVVGIPVVIGGAVRGAVMVLKGPRLQVGLEYARVLIQEDIDDEDLAKLRRPRFERKVETFSTGDFEVIGIPPGKYTVSLDGGQLASLGLQRNQLARPLTVESKPDGDIVEGVNFVVIERK